MNKYLKIGKNITLASLLLLFSCMNNPISPLFTNGGKVDLDSLYEKFKQKNADEYNEKMRQKKPDNSELNISINSGLQSKNNDKEKVLVV